MKGNNVHRNNSDTTTSNIRLFILLRMSISGSLYCDNTYMSPNSFTLALRNSP